RLSEGFSKEKFKKRFGRYPDEEIFRKAEDFEKNGLLEIKNGSIALTPEGFLLSNTIIGKLLEYY
ncbi:MAG: coproporphyrinogen III oxidase family protein, partial [Clostridia bacterium]|nr:coproporphyrinogen III oxidase family protein [Clostridia bacterium]